MSPPRVYRQRARARQQQATRRRITQAVVDLHGSVGPARTTVSAVAERAGVGRMTVYKHFPTDLDLFRACSGHWLERHPPPDLAQALARPRPAERLRAVLEGLYPYFETAYPMMGKVLRDAPQLPALEQVVEAGWLARMRTLEDLLTAEAPDNPRCRAVIRCALDLPTWARLRDSGLDPAGRIDLICDWYAAVAG